MLKIDGFSLLEAVPPEFVDAPLKQYQPPRKLPGTVFQGFPMNSSRAIFTDIFSANFAKTISSSVRKALKFDDSALHSGNSGTRQRTWSCISVEFRGKASVGLKLLYIREAEVSRRKCLATIDTATTITKILDLASQTRQGHHVHIRPPSSRPHALMRASCQATLQTAPTFMAISTRPNGITVACTL